MRYVVFIVVILSGFLNSVWAQNNQTVYNLPEANKIHYKEGQKIPVIISFKTEQAIKLTELEAWLNEKFGITPSDYSLELINTSFDPNGNGHFKYQQYFKQTKIEGAVFIAHTVNNKVTFLNGNIYNDINIGSIKSFNIDKARQSAIDYMGADIYKWELPFEEDNLKSLKADEKASYYPAGEQVILPVNQNNELSFIYTYKFNIYAHKPLKREMVYVDALKNEVIQTQSLLHHADFKGIAKTAYSGEQEIVFSQEDSVYSLKDYSRGNGIETFNMRNGTNYNSAQNFLSDSSYWNLDNDRLDQYALDVHWGAEMTYDYYLNIHGRNSIDNGGYKLRNYVHYNIKSTGQQDNINAFWDGEKMSYGDGDTANNVTPITGLDLIGHEITHGLTSFTANLVYNGESGALNEGMSDIFGTAIEFYANPDNANWTFGEAHGLIWRSLEDPHAYNLPNTYRGTYWYSGTMDNGGVHTNSSVFNYWFYLVSEGGEGTNDFGNNYKVEGVGIDKAANITFRALVEYMTPSTGFYEAALLTMQAANDLYSGCGPEVRAVANAMQAIGVLDTVDFIASADFSPNLSEFCEAPVNILFSNHSQYANTFSWDFGDGNISTEKTPIHQYNEPGIYDVTLIAQSEQCGTDTITITSAVSIDESNSCEVLMPDNAINSFVGCGYTLKDNGGDANYTRNNKGGITLYSNNDEVGIRLEFLSFDFSGSGDVLYIYDGPSVNSPLIGKYNGKLLPEKGTVFSTGSSITIVQDTYSALGEGFELTWYCTDLTNLPMAEFDVESEIVCDSLAYFYDQSSNNPTSWIWDFGDGYYSLDQNPVHTYTSPGSYTVTLIVTNENGVTELTKDSLISVKDYPQAGFYYSKEEKIVTFTNNSENADWYLWDFGDDNISEEKSPIHEFASSNNYTVTLTAGNHCGESKFVKSFEVVNVNSSAQSNIKLYPNPVKDVLYIQNAKGASFELLDLNGKVIKQGIVESDIAEIKMPVHVSDILFLKIQNESEIVVNKLIINQ